MTSPARPSVASARPRLLCVDDEPYVLEGLRDTLHRSFDVRIAESGPDGLAMLRARPDGFAVVISDMRMPIMSGAAFLREVRREAPDAVRILLTGHAEIDAAVKAVNEGQVFRFLTKPCGRDDLLRACAAGLGQHRMQTAERVLIEQTLHGAVKALTDVLALAKPAAFGRARRIQRTVALLVREIGLVDGWEVEMAAMLAHVGAVTLPDAIAEKLYAGHPLDDAEEALVATLPAATQRILGHIPRLEGVMQILAAHARTNGNGTGRVPLGARMLRIATDHDRLHAEGLSAGDALDVMRGRDGAYDTDMLAAFGRVTGASDVGHVVHEIAVPEIREGMMLADDVRSRGGQLLIARGFVVTPELVMRLAHLQDGQVREPLRVVILDEDDRV
jgi:response regulator RpfG family c-di-GMP phosphodiesterase